MTKRRIFPSGAHRRRAGASGLLLLFAACSRKEQGGITANGTIELTQSNVASQVGGRVAKLHVRDGAEIKVGDTVVTLVSPQLPSVIRDREAQVERARSQLSDLERGARSAELSRAESEWSAANADATRTASDSARLAPLAQSGTISHQQFETSRTAAQVAAAKRDAARAALDLLRAGARPDQISAARANVASTAAALEAARREAGELVLRAPVDGVVLEHFYEAGELAPAFKPVVVIGDPKRPWARVFVGSKQLPNVQRGASATGTVDGLPKRSFPGRVTVIDETAQYSPRVALTDKERQDMLFGVRVDFADTTGALKPGLPVTVHFSGTPTIPASTEGATP
jgi:HlyD family secretion protein